MHVVRVVRHGNSLAITVPKQVLAALRWQPRDYVVVEIGEVGLMVKTLEAWSDAAKARRKRGPANEDRPAQR